MSATIEEVQWEAGYIANRNNGRNYLKGYEAIATYSYQFEGKSYRSSKIGFTSGKSTQYDKQRRIYTRLKSHMDKNKPIPSYVNPSAPELAIIDRSFSWGMNIFMFITGLIALGLGLGVLRSIFR